MLLLWVFITTGYSKSNNDVTDELDFESHFNQAIIAPEAKGKVARAIRTKETIDVDGEFNEMSWLRAEEIYDFVQSNPDFGYAPTEQTEVKVIYDNDAVYIGVRVFDSQPDKITGQLTRRDEFSDSDWISIYIDSRNDRQTAYGFSVNPLGVKVDRFMFNDFYGDLSWDAVWECETKIDSLGWKAEFKIPFHVLRFSTEKELVWGFNVIRTIKRKQENSYWVLKPRKESGFVSRFGLLVGIDNIKHRPHLEVLPYTLGKSTFSPKDEIINPDGITNFHGIGSDFKYGLSSGITLDVTVNPDFGQVEEDPSVLNLSVYETFFPERRPFFLEGAKIFSTPYMLFHSRRIGRKPNRFDIEDDDEVISRPDFTTITGAVKMTGRTDNGISFGILDAFTSEEFADVDSVVTDEETEDELRYRRERLIEPYTNYLVARVKKEFNRGRSYFGGLTTAVNRMDFDSDYTGGLDWQLKTQGNDYSFTGQIAGSHAGDDEKENGYAVSLSADKISGEHLRAGIDFDLISPEFEINDLGFLRRNDKVDVDTYLTLLQLEPTWFFRRIRQRMFLNQDWNYNGLLTGCHIGFNTFMTFQNYTSLHVILHKYFSSYDDLETRGGPVIQDLGSHALSTRFYTDDRKPVQFSLGTWLSRGERNYEYNSFFFNMSVKPTPFILFSVSPNYSWGFRDSQWIDNFDDDDDDVDDHFVFGELHRNVFDLRLRTNITINRNLSFQYYMQPYIAVGRYENYKELAQEKTRNFKSYEIEDPDYDFNKKSIKSNAVIRWEYKPGSAFFFVWTQSRNDDDYPGDYEFGRDLKNAFLGEGINTFLVKLNYWFNI